MNLHTHAPFETEFRRLSRAFIDQIQLALTDAHGGNQNGIHEARKWIKRARGFLRLYESALGPAFNPCDEQLRAAGRALGPLRNRHSLEEAVRRAREIVAQHSPTDAAGAADDLAMVLPPHPATAPELDLVGLAAGAIAELKKELAAIRLVEPSIRHIRKGLQTTYRRTRRAFASAQKRPTPDTLHALRRQANYHRQHMRLLIEAWPAMITARADQGSRLHDLLGEERDLRILLAKSQASGGIDKIRRRRRKALNAEIDRHCRLLHGEAMALAARLFAERPARFAERIEAYWTANTVGKADT